MSSVQDLAEPGPRGTRRESASSRLRRLGFVDATRAQNLLEDKDLVEVLGSVGPSSPLVGSRCAGWRSTSRAKPSSETTTDATNHRVLWNGRANTT